MKAEELFKSLGYERKETAVMIEYFRPDSEEKYITFIKNNGQIYIGAYSLTKDEFKACAKQMDELELLEG